MAIETKIQPNTRQDEIDILSLIKTIWENKKLISRSSIILGIIGFFIAILSPNEFQSSTTFIPQSSNSQTSSLGGISSLAAIAGVNIGNSSSNLQSLSPVVYPKIINSIPFQLELLNTKFYYEDLNTDISLLDYYSKYKKAGITGYIKQYTLGLPTLILKKLRNNDNPKSSSIPGSSSLIQITPEQDLAIAALSNNLVLELNDKEGYLTLNTHYNNPQLAAQVTQAAFNLLQDYITKYRIAKAQRQLDFIHERYTEKKTEFEDIQNKLAKFKDRNKNISTAIAQTGEQELLSKYNVSYSVYSELAKQLEQAKIKVKEDTPIFTIINPVKIPNQKSGPNRLLIIIIFVILGSFVGCALIIMQIISRTLKDNWVK